MKRTREAKSIRLPLPVLRAVEAVYARVPSANCKGLCHETCGPIPMTRFEHDRITARVGYRPPPMLATGEGDGDDALRCTLLTPDNRCSVYDVRPLVCRLWGADEGMPCPWGCEPAGGRLSDVAAGELVVELDRATEGYAAAAGRIA